MAVGIATTPEEILGRLGVLTATYQSRHYLGSISEIEFSDTRVTDIILPGGLTVLQHELCSDTYDLFLREGILAKFPNIPPFYLDKYHWSSIQIAARDSQGYSGSARMIVREDGIGLPTLDDPAITFFQGYSEQATSARIEFSQFATRKGAHKLTASGILRTARWVSEQSGIKEWIATIDSTVVEKVLNGHFYGFDLPPIGPQVFYLGSISTPVWIDIEEALNRALNSGNVPSQKTAEFIRGSVDTGQDNWYLGV